MDSSHGWSAACRPTSSARVAVQSTVTMSGVPLVPPPPGKSVTAWPLADVVVRVLSVMAPNELVAVHCTYSHKPDITSVSASLSKHCFLNAFWTKRVIATVICL